MAALPQSYLGAGTAVALVSVLGGNQDPTRLTFPGAACKRPAQCTCIYFLYFPFSLFI
jgi:hypothetical protein